MLGQFLKRVFSRDDASPSPSSASASLAPTATARAPLHTSNALRPDSGSPNEAPPPSALTVAELTEVFAQQLRARVHELQNSLARDERRSDAVEFLDSLTTDFDAVVRQPPLAAQRALSVTRDTNSAIGRIVSLVEQDPGLGQALLRYANSAYYSAGGGRVVSLHASVHRVGTTGVHNVVLRTMVDGMLCRPGSAYQERVHQVWEHMVRTAPIARAIAAHFGVAPDEAYALGLLHDVGKLVIFDRLGELRQSHRREILIPPAVLSALLKILHEPLGGIAALQWGLGVGAASAIATHHRSPLPSERDPRSELLYVAERTDLARHGDAAPDFEAWWRDGVLSAPLAEVHATLESTPDEASEGAAV